MKRKTKAKKAAPKRVSRKAVTAKASSFTPGQYMVRKGGDDIPVHCASEAEVSALTAAHGADNVRRVS